MKSNYETTAASMLLRISAALLIGWFGLTVGFGCRPAANDKTGATADKPKVVRPVRVLVVDDEPLAEGIKYQWASRSERPIEVRTLDLASVLKAERLDADVIVYASGLLGTFVESELIQPFPTAALDGPQVARSELFVAPLQVEASWGGELFALPLGSPQFCLLFREADVEGVVPEVPTSWSEYLELAKQLTESAEARATSDVDAGESSDRPDDSSGPGDATAARYAIAEPLAKGWAGQLLLARAAGYVKHRSQYSTTFDVSSMDPLIAGPPYVRALEELKTAYEFAPPESLDWTPDDVRDAFYANRLSVAVTWPVGASSLRSGDGNTSSNDESAADSASSPANEPTSGEASAIGFARLPGSDQVYRLQDARWEDRRGGEDGQIPLLAISGRVGSVTREARRVSAAADVLAWISGRDWSSQVASRSRATTLFRQSHLMQPQQWTSGVTAEAAASYGEMVEQTQARSDVMTSIRIPGRDKYLAALDEAVRNAVSGKATPEEALESAARKWTEITDEMGRDEQRAAYLRSLGMNR